MKNYSFSDRPFKNEEYFIGGKYIVIDPCHILGDNQEFWDDYCNYCFPKNRPKRDPVYIKFDNIIIFTWSTKYGDGVYPIFIDEKIVGECGVDAGCLGLFPYEFVRKYIKEYPTEMTVLDIKMFFIPICENGNGFFDNVKVITDDSDREEEE